jgi:hypothetical protein
VIDEVFEEKGCLRNKVLVVHVSDKQSHFLIEAFINARNIVDLNNVYTGKGNQICKVSRP